MPVPFYFLQTSHKYHEENHERILGNLPFCICSENKNSILFILQILKVKLLTLFEAQADTGVFPGDP